MVYSHHTNLRGPVSARASGNRAEEHPGERTGQARKLILLSSTTSTRVSANLRLPGHIAGGKGAYRTNHYNQRRADRRLDSQGSGKQNLECAQVARQEEGIGGRHSLGGTSHRRHRWWHRALFAHLLADEASR